MLIKFNYWHWKYDYYNYKLQSHRLGGPSAEGYSKNPFGFVTTYWANNGKTHREDGPAIKYYDGGESYWLNGKRYTEKEYWEIIRFGAFI